MLRKESAEFLVEVLSKTSADEDEFIITALLEKYKPVKKESSAVETILEKINGVKQRQRKESSAVDSIINKIVESKQEHRKDSASLAGVTNAIKGARTALKGKAQNVRAILGELLEGAAKKGGAVADDAKLGANILTGGRFGNIIGGPSSYALKYENPLRLMTGAGAAAGLGAGLGAGYGVAKANEPTILEKLGLR